MPFTEQRIIKQITVLPASGGVNVQWANQVLKNGNVISENFERKAYTQDQLATFHTEVGNFDVNAFTTSFNATALDDKEKAAKDKEKAESDLTKANTRIADLEAQLAAANVQPPV